MKFKVEDFTDEVKKDNTPNDSQKCFCREIEDYQNNPYLVGQPIYLVCPQYTYEVEMQPYKVEKLLNDGSLVIKEIYETSDFGITPPREEALPNIEEDFEVLHEALYIVDGVNAYRMEVPMFIFDKWVKNGLATPFPNGNSEMLFQKLKRSFQEHCNTNGLTYTSWVNE